MEIKAHPVVLVLALFVSLCIFTANGAMLYGITQSPASGSGYFVSKLDPVTGELTSVQLPGNLPAGFGSMTIDQANHRLFIVFDDQSILVYDLQSNKVVHTIKAVQNCSMSDFQVLQLYYFKGSVFFAGPCHGDFVLGQINPNTYNVSAIKTVLNLTKQHEFVPGWSTLAINPQTNLGFFNALAHIKNNPKEATAKVICFSVSADSYGNIKWVADDPYFSGALFSQESLGGGVFGVGSSINPPVFDLDEQGKFVSIGATKDLVGTGNVLPDPDKVGVYYTTQQLYNKQWVGTNYVLTLTVDKKNETKPISISSVKFPGTYHMTPVAVASS